MKQPTFQFDPKPLPIYELFLYNCDRYLDIDAVAPDGTSQCLFSIFSNGLRRHFHFFSDKDFYSRNTGDLGNKIHYFKGRSDIDETQSVKYTIRPEGENWTPVLDMPLQARLFQFDGSQHVNLQIKNQSIVNPYSSSIWTPLSLRPNGSIELFDDPVPFSVSPHVLHIATDNQLNLLGED